MRRFASSVLLALFLCLSHAGPSAAQTSTQNPPDSPVEAKPVVVTATRVEEDIQDVPASVSVVEQKDVQLGQQTKGISEPLRGVPGVQVQNQENYAGDVRLSIRGFGSRGAFGIQGIKVFVDGLPETTPDGQTNLDSLEMGSIERIEVLRGPSAALYGASAGGLVSVTTERPPSEPMAEAKVTGGSFGFMKEQLKFGEPGLGGGGAIFNIANVKYGGYRDFSAYEARSFYGKIVNPLTESSELTAILSYYDSPKAEDPQGLTREEFDGDPRQSRPDGFFPGARTQNTGEEVVEGKAGLVWSKHLDDDELALSVYRVFREFSARIVPRVIEFERYVLGGSAQYTWNTEPGGQENALALGVDIQEQNDRRRNFANNEGHYGDLNLNQIEKAKALGVFVSENIQFGGRLGLSVSARNDRIKLSVADHFPSDRNQSGGREFNHTSQGAGVSYAVTGGLNVFANYSQAFEIPTLTQLDNPSGKGGFNEALDPQLATSVEIGLKGRPGEQLEYEVSVFQIDGQDEIVLYHEPGSDVDFYRNAGETERTGAELSLRYRFLPSLAAMVTYSQLSAEYTDYKTDVAQDDGSFQQVSYKGNKIPGIPETQAYLRIEYTHSSGFYVTPEALQVSAVQVDDANSDEADGYAVVNLRVGYLTQLGGDYPFTVFGGGNNLMDETYTQNVRINDAGSRYFEAAPPANYYLGVSLGWAGPP